MFGNNDDNQQQNQSEPTTVQPTPTLGSNGMQGFTPPPSQPSTNDNSSSQPAQSPVFDVSSGSIVDSTDTLSLPDSLTDIAPVTDNSAAPEPPTTAPTPAGDNSDASASADEGISTDTEASQTTSTNKNASTMSDDLLSIKQDAIQELSPLIEHLDQSPEERFRTTMMMIQATDDSTKLREAYSAAQQIEDKKIRAQALLDVVNEINYFTQQAQEQEA